MPEDTSQKTSNMPARDENGRFIKSSTGITYSTTPLTKSEADVQTSTYNITKQRTDPPLLFLKISNPVTYIKRWWKRLLGNEGVEFRIRVKPLTAIAIALSLGIFGFGVGRVTLPPDSPIVRYIPQFAAIPTVNPWRETAFTGVLRSTNGDIYLFTTESEALSLIVPSDVNLTGYVGKNILIKGLYNEKQRLLKITKSDDIELLNSKPQKIPTTLPSPKPTLFPTIAPGLIPTYIPTEPSIPPSRDNPSM